MSESTKGDQTVKSDPDKDVSVLEKISSVEPDEVEEGSKLTKSLEADLIDKDSKTTLNLIARPVIRKNNMFSLSGASNNLESGSSEYIDNEQELSFKQHEQSGNKLGLGENELLVVTVSYTHLRAHEPDS